MWVNTEIIQKFGLENIKDYNLHRTLLPELEKWYFCLRGRGACLASILKSDLKKALKDITTM